VAVLLAAVLFVGCRPSGVSPEDLEAWSDHLEDVTPSTRQPPLARQLLNVVIRAGVPFVCPALVGQAAPEWRSFVDATCDAIVASDDPFTTTVELLPALCARDPPLGGTVFPNLAPALTATCPLLLQLPGLLGLARYVPVPLL
jgi:hypothetical protein